MRQPSPRVTSDTCRQYRPTLGRDGRGGHTFASTPRVQAVGEPAGGFACSFKYVGVREIELGGGPQQVQVYSLIVATRDIRADDLIDCPGRFSGMKFRVAEVAWPAGGGPGGIGGFVTATCYGVQPPTAQG